MIVMDNNLDEVIKQLSQVYDKESKDNFVTVYLNRQADKNFLEKRIQTCAGLLEKDERENFQKTIEKIKGFLEKNNENNIAIFASDKHDFFTTVSLHIQINNLLIVDSSPYIRPLTRILDEWESFTLVLLNTNQAKIFSVELGKAEQEKKLSSDIMSKHKKGGWSQARFQRIRKGAIHDFFSELVEKLEEIGEKQIVLAGPGIAKTQFKEMLPAHLQQKIVDVVDVDMDDEQESIKQSLSIISEKEEMKSKDLVQQLRSEVLKDGLAVYGFKDTLKAARMGQIDVLLVEKDFKVKGCLCEHCQILKSGPIKDCPVCGGPTTEADVIEEIIEFAERTGASIEFTDDEEIKKLGHIGGLLRFQLG